MTAGDGPRTLTLLGSTGSIGTQALEVVDAHPGRFAVTALAAGSDVDRLVAQARRYRPECVALADAHAAAVARDRLPDVEVLAGDDGVVELAGRTPAHPGTGHTVLNGMVGSRGLRPTLAALDAGHRLALANKESLIVGGELVTGRAAPGQLVPVDSEHSALAQCLRAGGADEVQRLVVTASGGPFRGRRRADLAGVSAADALAHPTWSMGPVITVNSATLANKGLEVIEAHLLFDVPYDRIAVVVHPQSIVHSMVEFTDGSTIAQLSPPDMRLPIQLALHWPDRLPSAPSRLDWTAASSLEFAPLDTETFPMVDLAVAAGRAGGSAPATFNAANEEAVDAFLAGRLSFLGIATVVETVLEQSDTHTVLDVEALRAAEEEARTRARRVAAQRRP